MSDQLWKKILNEGFPYLRTVLFSAVIALGMQDVAITHKNKCIDHLLYFCFSQGRELFLGCVKKQVPLEFWLPSILMAINLFLLFIFDSIPSQ